MKPRHEAAIRRVIALHGHSGGLVDVSPGPSFAFYQDRWLSDGQVALMDCCAEGIHHRLMCYAWQESPPCSLPLDEEQLRAWSKYPDDATWDRTKRVIFGDGVQRAWVRFDDRWWQVGLCRTYLEQIERRLKKQRGGSMKVANADGHPEQGHCRSVVKQCSLILDEMQSPPPAPVPEKKPRVASSAVEDAWQVICDGRDAAGKLIGERLYSIKLTEQRRKHVRQIAKLYPLEQLQSAFGRGLLKSEYHLGRGRWVDNGPRLSFEQITTINSKVNQIEILSDLADSGPSFGGFNRPSEDRDSAESIT